MQAVGSTSFKMTDFGVSPPQVPITTVRPRNELRLIALPVWSRSAKSGARRAPAGQVVPGSAGAACAGPPPSSRATAMPIATPAPTTSAPARTAIFSHEERFDDGWAATSRHRG